MGRLIDGEWSTEWYDTKSTGGRFERKASSFRDWVRADGSTRFAPEAGRYHLYVSKACPWAHRALIYRALEGLEDAISISIVDPLMGDDGWAFSDGPGCIPDTLHGCDFLREVYVLADPHYTGRVTVPVLWDREHSTIVNNESSEIIRMLYREFGDIASSGRDSMPEDLHERIDEINALIYNGVNNGVYRCGFATSQSAYEEAFEILFETLDGLEQRLSTRRYLMGARLTEADWRLFTTLLRFDPVYFGHFKCNRNRLVDFPNLWNYTRELFQFPGVEGTVDFDHIKQHYYRSHGSINPTGVVPVGPEIDFWQPHDRERFPAG